MFENPYPCEETADNDRVKDDQTDNEEREIYLFLITLAKGTINTNVFLSLD